MATAVGSLAQFSTSSLSTPRTQGVRASSGAARGIKAPRLSTSTPAASIGYSSRSSSILGAGIPVRTPAVKESGRQGKMETTALLSFLQRGSSVEEREKKKEKLLEAIRPLARGVNATEEDQTEIEKLSRELEKVNPNRKALSTPLISGKWELVYTTSAGILQVRRPFFLRPWGPILQIIDADALKARNEEGPPFFNSVDADLTPTSASAVDVQFKTFFILGFIPFPAPFSARGALDITYLDETMRISRGDKGNIFVLLQRDPKKRLA